MNDDVATQQIAVRKDQLEIVSTVKHGGRRHGEKGHTPSLPKLGISASSATVRSSSRCRLSFRFLSISDATGSAKIHLCMTVQTLGVALEGVMRLMSSAVGFGCDKS